MFDRYVDTFNQGGGSPANLFQSPSVPSVKPAVAANAKFFVPTPAPPHEYSMEAIAENIKEDSATTENPSTSNMNKNGPSHPSTSSALTMQRFSSMDNIARKGAMINGNGPVSSHSRRTASWSGSFSDSFSPPKAVESKSQGEMLSMSPSFMPSNHSMTRMSSSGSFGDDLHEVELWFEYWRCAYQVLFLVVDAILGWEPSSTSWKMFGGAASEWGHGEAEHVFYQTLHIPCPS